MRQRFVGLLAAALFLIAPAAAQSQASDSEVAARQLIATMRLPDQFMAMLPMIFKAIKPSIV